MGNTGSTHAGFSKRARLDTSQVADLRGGGGRFGGVPSGRMTIVGWGIGVAFNAWDVSGTHDRARVPARNRSVTRCTRCAAALELCSTSSERNRME